MRDPRRVACKPLDALCYDADRNTRLAQCPMHSKEFR
jgi:hypothetical protein